MYTSMQMLMSNKETSTYHAGTCDPDDRCPELSSPCVRRVRRRRRLETPISRRTDMKHTHTDLGNIGPLGIGR